MEQSLNAFVEPEAQTADDNADAELAASDAAADLQAEEAAGNFTSPKSAAVVKPVVVSPDSQAPLISMEEAAKRLGPKVLAALDVKFKGSLTQVRHTDENDMLF